MVDEGGGGVLLYLYFAFLRRERLCVWKKEFDCCAVKFYRPASAHIGFGIWNHNLFSTSFFFFFLFIFAGISKAVFGENFNTFFLFWVWKIQHINCKMLIMVFLLINKFQCIACFLLFTIVYGLEWMISCLLYKVTHESRVHLN